MCPNFQAVSRGSYEQAHTLVEQAKVLLDRLPLEVSAARDVRTDNQQRRLLSSELSACMAFCGRRGLNQYEYIIYTEEPLYELPWRLH
jgi:hypothetical protein